MKFPLKIPQNSIFFKATKEGGKNVQYTHKKKYWPGRDFSEANFDGFGQFSQKVLKIQKFYIPHWKALCIVFQS